MKITSLLTSIILAATAAGCGPTWVVVKQANPNPMVGKKSFAVDAVSYEGLMVGDKAESQYMAGKEPASVESFNKDKAEGAQLFTTRLGEELKAVGLETAAGGFVIKPRVSNFEPGTFNGFVNIPTTVQVNAVVAGADGTALDEVQFRGVVAADIMHPSSGQRMRDALMNISKQIAAYLTTRTTVAAK